MPEPVFELEFFTSRERGESDRLREELSRANLRNRDMRAKVDAASTNDENKRHWGQADYMGPNAAYDPGTRARLRNRGRYETINNAYCRGMVRTLAYDLIGRTPRLQLSIPGVDGKDNSDAAKQIERQFKKWGKSIKFGRKLRVMEKSAARDGEIFAVFKTNPKIKGTVKLDVQPIEAEQCCAPSTELWNKFHIDGIDFDQQWNPLAYWFLKFHPGETGPSLLMGQPTAFVKIPAENVMHWYEQDRAGQERGIPKITAGLPLFAQLRRYTSAVLTAAEIAAMLAGIMKTNAPPDPDNPINVKDWTMVDLVRGALMSLPAGWDATQFRPEQPTTTYPEFKREILSEAGRSASLPLNGVSGNSSGYNFSSGRLDHVPYQQGVKIDREDLADIILDPTFVAWESEASLAGVIPEGLPPIEEWTWTWIFDGFGSIDRAKDASANDTELTNGTKSFADIVEEDGGDWQEKIDQLAKERDYAKSKGFDSWPLTGTPAAATNAAMPEPPQDAPPPRRRPMPSRNGHSNGVGGVH